MALASMTGFSRVQGAWKTMNWAWEIGSVNGKGLDVRLRLPSGCETLEPKIRRIVTERLSRGSVTVALQMARCDADCAFEINETLLQRILDLSDVWQSRGVKPPRLDGLLALRGVLVPVSETLLPDSAREALETAQLVSLKAGLASFVQAREVEGAHLGAVLTAQLDNLVALVTEARSTEALRPHAVRERLKRQLDEMLTALGAGLVSEDRLAQELAILAVKTDVSEELDRLSAHIDGARAQLKTDEPSGRHLEFLAQELNREANTLCAKSQDVALTRIGLEMKAAINQIREQVLNLE